MCVLGACVCVIGGCASVGVCMCVLGACVCVVGDRASVGDVGGVCEHVGECECVVGALNGKDAGDAFTSAFVVDSLTEGVIRRCGAMLVFFLGVFTCWRDCRKRSSRSGQSKLDRGSQVASCTGKFFHSIKYSSSPSASNRESRICSTGWGWVRGARLVDGGGR
jgi:hypothetical protein